MMFRVVTASLVTALAFSACGSDEEPTPTPTPAEKCAGVGTEDTAASVCVLSGVISKDATLTADTRWLLRGNVFVGDGSAKTVLTLQPGTTVYGESSSRAALTIRQGSQIIADGTAAKPIVFTSSKNVGSRGRGDWGGLIINGKARINEGTGTAMGEGDTGVYGGTDDSDNSGILRYVRVEFAGAQITEENEYNGIAFQGVGNGTIVEHLHAHMTADDGVEFFGGAVNVRWLLVTGAGDDSIDWTFGYRGKIQFAAVQQYGAAGDDCDNGIEADNNNKNNDATPRSRPVLANLTLIGVPTFDKSDIGVLIREGTGIELYNSIVTGFNDACLDIDNAKTFTVANAGEVIVEHVVFDCAKNFKENNEKDANMMTIMDAFDVSDFMTVASKSSTTAASQLMAPLNIENPNFKPMASSPAMMDVKTLNDPFFTATTYRGAVDPANDWTAGWTTFARN